MSRMVRGDEPLTPAVEFYVHHLTCIVRDAFQIPGSVTLSETGRVQQVTLNERHPLAVAVKTAFASDELSLYLGKN